MNVLILTPDAVGSTLLQRLITIYMQFHDFDQPVINLHELTNGLEKYFSTDFNREIVSKRRVENWVYYQSLEDIVRILSSVDHYKTSRLALYHIKNRQDPIEKQVPFYHYLNENFFVIACRRHNIFEHALSMALNTVTKKLNVYNHAEKIRTFIDIYADRIQIDERVFLDQLESYRNYIAWSQNYFAVASYFYYDEHVENIEKYILDLPIFQGHKQRVTWKQRFNIEFNDWNRYHHASSDLGSLSLTQVSDVRNTLRNPPNRLELYQKISLPEWPAVQTDAEIANLPVAIQESFSRMIPQHINQNLIAGLDPNVGAWLEKHRDGYQSASQAIERMRELDIIVSPPPIKKQTLIEKKEIISNFDRCLDKYNDWIIENPNLGRPLTYQDMEAQHQQENSFWRDSRTQIDVKSVAPPISKLGYQNDDDL